MSNAISIPAVVSKRNAFNPADEFVENALPYLPKEFQHVNFRSWLLKYTETVIRGVAHHFGVAAERGIAQAAELLCDPEFYQTRKQKRAKWRQQMEESVAKQKWDAMERRLCPTVDQIAHDIKWCEDQLAYHESKVAKNKVALERLRGITPKNTEVFTLRKAYPFSFQPLLPPHGEKKPKQIKQGNASNQCPQNMHWRIENNQNE